MTETLVYRPAKLVVLRRVRPKSVDPRDEARDVIMAALAARPIEKGLDEPSLLAHVVIEKYVDHMPLYRQVQRFTRAGITLSDSTLGDWISTTADLVQQLYEALGEEARQSGYLQNELVSPQSKVAQASIHPLRLGSNYKLVGLVFNTATYDKGCVSAAVRERARRHSLSSPSDALTT